MKKPKGIIYFKRKTLKSFLLFSLYLNNYFSPPIKKFTLIVVLVHNKSETSMFHRWNELFDLYAFETVNDR